MAKAKEFIQIINLTDYEKFQDSLNVLEVKKGEAAIKKISFGERSKGSILLKVDEGKFSCDYIALWINEFYPEELNLPRGFGKSSNTKAIVSRVLEKNIREIGLEKQKDIVQLFVKSSELINSLYEEIQMRFMQERYYAAKYFRGEGDTDD